MYVELTPSVHRVLPLLVQIYFSNGYNLAVQIKLAQPKGFRIRSNIYGWSFFAKIVGDFQPLTIFAKKKLYRICLTGF